MKERLIRAFMFFSSLFLFTLIVPVLLVHLSGCSDAKYETEDGLSAPEIRDIDTRLSTETITS